MEFPLLVAISATDANTGFSSDERGYPVGHLVAKRHETA